jgi:chromosome segregation ATPase
MSENKHVAAIRQNAAYLRDRHAMNAMADTLDRHAAALADQLAEAERQRAECIGVTDSVGENVMRLESQLAEAEAERSQMERFLTYHEHIEEFREVQRNPSLWMHRYINGDLPDTEGTHHE